MPRKKWTAREEATAEYLLSREKKKWQIALRRYVLKQGKSQEYAPYFGVDIEMFRKWIEIQFTEHMSWLNFSLAWQFDHLVPLNCFDFADDRDMRLCWNFINIRPLALKTTGPQDSWVNLFALKSHFQALFLEIGYEKCRLMAQKIDSLLVSKRTEVGSQRVFLVSNMPAIKAMAEFDSSDFLSLNDGSTIENILQEKAFLNKYSRS